MVVPRPSLDLSNSLVDGSKNKVKCEVQLVSTVSFLQSLLPSFLLALIMFLILSFPAPMLNGLEA